MLFGRLDRRTWSGRSAENRGKLTDSQPDARRSEGICDPPEIVIIDILIVPQHLGAGVAYDSQFVLVRRLDQFEHGGKGVPATVRRVLVPAVLIDGIVDPYGRQGGVETIILELPVAQYAAIGCVEDLARRPPRCQPLYDRQDLGRDRDDPIPAGLGLCTPAQTPIIPVKLRGIQSQKLAGPEAEHVTAVDIIGIGYRADSGFDGLALLRRKADPVLAGVSGDPQELRQVAVLGNVVARNPVFVHQPAEGLHVLSGPPPGGAIIHALLQVIDVDHLQLQPPDWLKMLEGCRITVHGGFVPAVGGLPEVVQRLEGDLLATLLATGPQGGEIVQRSGFGGEPSFRPADGEPLGHGLVLPFPAEDHLGRPGAAALVGRAGAVGPGFRASASGAGGDLLFSAGRAEICPGRQLRMTFFALHFETSYVTIKGQTNPDAYWCYSARRLECATTPGGFYYVKIRKITLDIRNNT